MIQMEMGYYYKLQEFEEYIKYTTFENLEKWFVLMKDNAEEAIVTCNGCQK